MSHSFLLNYSVKFDRFLNNWFITFCQFSTDSWQSIDNSFGCWSASWCTPSSVGGYGACMGVIQIGPLCPETEWSCATFPRKGKLVDSFYFNWNCNFKSNKSYSYTVRKWTYVWIRLEEAKEICNDQGKWCSILSAYP